MRDDDDDRDLAATRGALLAAGVGVVVFYVLSVLAVLALIG